MIPQWLHWLSIASLSVGFVCAAIIAIDETRDPQHMWIMNVVWPVAALFGSLVALWGYFSYGKLASDRLMQEAMDRDETPPTNV